MSRCDWCGDDPLYVRYHDEEWGVPLRDEQRMFEFLLLEGAQAGLSWITILRRREGYRQVFDDFDVEAIAAYSDADVASRLRDRRIIRNKLKVLAARKNAQATMALYEAGDTLCDYFWRFVEDRPMQTKRQTMADIPASTPLSEQISKDMKQRGFAFVGPTIVYAHMQATGMVNDHVTRCPRHAVCASFA